MSGLEFDIEDEETLRIWGGDIEYVKDPSNGYRPLASAELGALAGQYYSDDRWEIPIRIYAREEKLMMKSVNYIETLTALDDGDWQMGDGAHRARFDGVIDGKPHRLSISGSQYMRRFG